LKSKNSNKSLKEGEKSFVYKSQNWQQRTWINFTSHFFSGNPLILEYFEGNYPKHIPEMLETFSIMRCGRQNI